MIDLCLEIQTLNLNHHNRENDTILTNYNERIEKILLQQQEEKFLLKNLDLKLLLNHLYAWLLGVVKFLAPHVFHSGN